MKASSIEAMSEQLGRVQPTTDADEATVRAHVDQAARDDVDRALLLGALFGDVA